MNRTNKNNESILKELAARVAELAALSVQQEKKQMWSKLNRLVNVKPMVWINEIPWHEMDVNGELTLQTTGKLNQHIETELRRTIYLWEHMRADMVIESYIDCPISISNTGIGITPNIHSSVTDLKNDVKGLAFEAQLLNEDDIYKIQEPKVIYDLKENESNLQYLKYIFDGILEVRMGAPSRHDFKLCLSDDYAMLRGIEQAMMDLVLDPEFVHKAFERLYNAKLSLIKQYEALHVLKLNNGNYRVGSGGLGYTDELPGSGYYPDNIRTIDMWGSAQDQIFCQVSPAMHDEFALRYVMPWMEMFGCTYYGCCEPLHRKIDILRKIPNLRKISMSPWIIEDEAIENVSGDYVFSYKPSPAVFVSNHWEPEQIRRDLDTFLKKAQKKGCIIEIIMKDISTVQYKPQRLWEWASIASDVAKNS